MRWQDHTREGLQMIPTMQAAGYDPVFDEPDVQEGRVTPDRPPHVTPTFRQRGGTRRVWRATLNNPKRNVWLTYDISLPDDDYAEHETLQAFLEKKAVHEAQ